MHTHKVTLPRAHIHTHQKKKNLIALFHFHFQIPFLLSFLADAFEFQLPLTNEHNP